MKVYLLRHGETESNRNCILQGWSDIPLNDRGIELAELTAEGLKDISFDRIYSSPLIRAYTTAEIIRGDRDIEIITDDRLKEINLGDREGTPIVTRDSDPDDPMYRFEFDTGRYLPPTGGESFEQLYSRTGEFWREVILPLEKECDIILIAGHGGMNRSLINTLMGTPIERFWDVKLDNCAITIIDVKDGVSEVVEVSKKFYSRDDERFKLKPGAVSIYG